jgi:hypothetical protein
VVNVPQRLVTGEAFLHLADYFYTGNQSGLYGMLIQPEK